MISSRNNRKKIESAPIRKIKTKKRGSILSEVPGITGLAPEEMIFAYEWAQSPEKPMEALLASGLIHNTTKRKEAKDILRDLKASLPVQKAFKEAMLYRIESLKSTKDKAKTYLSKMAYADPGKCLDDNGEVLPLKDIPLDTRTTISEYESKMFYPPVGHPYQKVKIKFYDAKDALKVLLSNAKEEEDRLKGFIPGGNGNTYNIQNNSITNIGSGNTYKNQATKELDIRLLDSRELDILLKVIGIEIDQGAIDAKSLLNDTFKEFGNDDGNLLDYKPLDPKQGDCIDV